MRCTFKAVFYVNGSKERNGIVSIMGRVTINGTIAQFSCKQSVTKAICDILAVFLQSKSIKLVVMTLKELLDSLSFDEIAPNAFIGGNLATWQLYSNKYTIYIIIINIFNYYFSCPRA